MRGVINSDFVDSVAVYLFDVMGEVKIHWSIDSKEHCSAGSETSTKLFSNLSYLLFRSQIGQHLVRDDNIKESIVKRQYNVVGGVL